MALPSDLQTAICGYLPFRFYDNYNMPFVAWRGFFEMRNGIKFSVVEQFLTPHTASDQELCRKVAYYAGESSEKAQLYLPTDLVVFNAVQKLDLLTYFNLINQSDYNLPEITFEILRRITANRNNKARHVQAKKLLQLSHWNMRGGSGKELLYEIQAGKIVLSSFMAKELSKGTFESTPLPTAYFAAGYMRACGRNIDKNLEDEKHIVRICHTTSYMSGYIAAGGRNRRQLGQFFDPDDDVFFNGRWCKALALHNLPYSDDLGAYDDSEGFILAKLGHITLLSFLNKFADSDHLRSFPGKPANPDWGCGGGEITLALMPPAVMQARASAILPLITKYYHASPLREAFLTKLHFIIAPETWTTPINRDLAVIFRRADIGIFGNNQIHHLATKFCDPLQVRQYVTHRNDDSHKIYYAGNIISALAYNAFAHHRHLAFAQLLGPDGWTGDMLTLESFRAQLHSDSSRVVVEGNNYLVTQLLPFLVNPHLETLSSKYSRKLILVASYYGRELQISGADEFIDYFRQRGAVLVVPKECYRISE